MKSLYRIQHALYSQPWLIKPTVHQSLVEQFENYMKCSPDKKNEMPDDVEDEDEDMMEQEAPVQMGPQVAVVSVEGIIGKHLSMLETMCGGCDLDMVTQALEMVVNDPNVSDVILYISSPGGTVTGVQEAGEKIKELSQKKRIIAYTDTLSASAAYWLMSQCTAAYCSPSADVGSIGVYSLILDESRALEDAGIKVNSISAGKWKLAGAPFKPLNDEERAMFQAGVDKIYNTFKTAIKSNRDIKDEDMEGQVFDGEEAVMKNLVDGNINSLEELMDLLTTIPKA